jgi:hypothetical protein
MFWRSASFISIAYCIDVVSYINREKDLMMYGIVGVLLLASFLMSAPANQYQKIFAQKENATDAEIPKFENGTATFVPPPESEREAPPVPSNAIKGADLPKETPPKDPDSDPLSVTNRTELLEVLPANSTKIIEHVNDDLKNSTGEGLLPPAIMDKIKSGEGQGQGNKTILDISSPKELDEIKNFSDSTTNVTKQAAEEGEPISISNVTNATAAAGAPEGQEQAQTGGEVTNVTNATGGKEQAQTGGEVTNVTNATGGEEQAQTGGEANATATSATGGKTPSQSREEAKQTEGEKEQAKTGAEEQALAGTPEASNMTNATSATGGKTPSQSREEAKQTEGEKEQAKTGAEEQALAGTPEASNMTNATSATGGETPSQSREEAKQTEGEKEQAKTGAEEQALAGTPEASNMTNATSATGGETQSQKGKEQKQTGGGEETTTIIGKQKQTGGGEETTTIIGKQKQTGGGEETSQDSLNTTNVTSMLNATDSKDGNDNPKDGG